MCSMPAPIKEPGVYLGNPSTEPTDQKYYSPWIIVPVTGTVGVGLYFAVLRLMTGPSSISGQDRHTEKNLNQCIVDSDFDDCDTPGGNMGDGNSYVAPRFGSADGGGVEMISAAHLTALALLVVTIATVVAILARRRVAAQALL